MPNCDLSPVLVISAVNVKFYKTSCFDQNLSRRVCCLHPPPSSVNCSRSV